MTQDDYSLSNLDSLLSKDQITEDDLLHLPELLLEESKNSLSKTPLIQQSANLPITPADKPTIALNDRPKKRKPTAPLRPLFRRQRKSKEATVNYSFTESLQF